MFIKTTKVVKKGKLYTCYLLTESYRDTNGIPRNKTILNVTSWGKEKVLTVKKLLRGESLATINEIATSSGKAIGALHVFNKLAEELGIQHAIKATKGTTLLSKIMLLIIGRILTQGSRLHLLEWGKTEEIETILGLNPTELTTDKLYETLDWLSDHQEEIEQKLFQQRTAKTGKTPRIYLYDVTSSYLEGEQNELANYGYNRDKKRGKQQIVIGLLTDEEGYPLAIRVFNGNTTDTKTVQEQITTLAQKFNVKEIILIGDKGMIKTAQTKDLNKQKYHYITSITKAQIQTLIKKDLLQLSLFDEELGEITDNEKRYIYRRNPIRAEELQKGREQREAKIATYITKKNNYLKEHPKAKTATAEKNIQTKIKQYKCPWVTTTTTDRTITMTINTEKKKEEAVLDGCFVIKTDCLDKDLSTQTIHDRYKDLKHVEAAFRTIKTGFLEIRPIFVRKESRTRGHVFVTMLAYLLMHEFTRRTKDIPGTVAYKVDKLDKIQTVFITVANQTIKRVPTQERETQQLLKACELSLPVFV